MIDRLIHKNLGFDWILPPEWDQMIREMKEWNKNYENYFKDKTILISGGTGSFGNAVLKRILQEDIGEVRIFSRDEKKQDDMRKAFSDKRIKFYIGDVRDYQSIFDALHNVDFVFHAAALKQVPSCEFYPMQAVKTNILGSNNMLIAVQEQNVQKSIFLSTDKAVYPINAMGMTKALMEKYDSSLN